MAARYPVDSGGIATAPMTCLLQHYDLRQLATPDRVVTAIVLNYTVRAKSRRRWNMPLEVGGLTVIWGIISLITGFLILVFPRLLSFLVGVYLLVIGALALIRGIFL